MKHVKLFGLVNTVVIISTALLGVCTASGTVLSVGGAYQQEAVAFTATLTSGSSSILKMNGETIGTCTTSELQGKTESPFEGTRVGGEISLFTIGECSYTSKVLANGSFTIEWIPETTNGTLSSSGTERTILIPIFGISATCKTGAGTDIGTVTGKKEGHSTFDIYATIQCGWYGNLSWTANYTVTSPTGLGVEGKEAAPPKEGTELYKTTGSGKLDTLGVGTEITATMKSGTSLLLKDSLGTATDTCTASEVKGKVESAGGGASHPSGKVSGLSFTGCSHTTDVISNGELEVKSIPGSTNGTVISKGAEVQVKSTFFGITVICKTGTGTAMGTLTGAEPGAQATIDINATIDCGSLGKSSLTGTYLVTEPTGLVVEEA